jgi:quinol monooxygenase YgiN
MIIVAGTFRVPEDRLAELLPVASATLAATRQEEGCITYSYAFDMEDRGLIRVYEEWQNRTHLDEHFKQPHMIPWRRMLAEIGASGRSLKVYEAGEGEGV